MVVDGTDLKYLLEKKGYSLTDIARQLDITPQTVFRVVRGLQASRRVKSHIESLLGIAPGELEIMKNGRDELVEVA